MNSLIEEKYEKFNDIDCKSIKMSKGEHFPQIILSLVERYKDKILFGGSSLIHDLYFPEEIWENRDYDLWCLSEIYDKIKRNFDKTPRAVKIKEESFTNESDYYGIFKTVGITEYLYNESGKDLKIQLINIGSERSNLNNVMKNIDLSFNSVFFDGERLIYIDTTEEQIKSKLGRYLSKKFLCDCSNCRRQRVFTDKEKQRIEKYKKRGFSILNICSICNENAENTLIHSVYCFKKHLGIPNTTKNFFKIGKILTEDKINIIKDIIHNSTSNGIIICGLLLILSTTNTDLFNELFEENKSKIDPYSMELNECMDKMVGNGLVTGFTKFYELIEPYINQKSYIRLGELFEKCVNKNYISMVKYMSSKSNRFQVTIYEDTIIEHKIFLSVFDFYIETRNISIIINEFPKVKEISSIEVCPICQSSEVNIEIGCNHQFCSSCLMSYFSLEEKKQKTLLCPICRSDFYNNSSK